MLLILLSVCSKLFTVCVRRFLKYIFIMFVIIVFVCIYLRNKYVQTEATDIYTIKRFILTILYNITIDVNRKVAFSKLCKSLNCCI